MKYVNYIMLVLAVMLAFAGLYYWLVAAELDRAALAIALATGLHAVYLHSTKADR